MLLKFIARVAVKYLGNAAGFGIAGDAIIDIWDLWNKARPSQQEKREDLEALAKQSPGDSRRIVDEVVQEVAGDQPEPAQITLKTFLTQVPAQTRKSLRRVNDPTGTTVPSGLTIGPEKITAILPPKLPRFKPGDRPPGIGDWQLEELLGVGGFGEVWKAQNPHFDSVPPVALKFCLDPTAKDRLLRYEAKVLNQVMRQGRHPGIVQLRHTYLGADPPCLEYEYIEGGDLAGVVYRYQAKKGQLPPDMATRIVLRLARAVAGAHKLNPPVVHRDLKPANVLVRTKDGNSEFLITDFGIGGVVASQIIEQTQRGSSAMMTSVAGAYTPHYASPEQMRGEDPHPRDDVHALGVIWYQLLTGDLTRGVGADYADDLRDLGVGAEVIEALVPGLANGKPR
jgi:hypothetical protein